MERTPFVVGRSAPLARAYRLFRWVSARFWRRCENWAFVLYNCVGAAEMGEMKRCMPFARPADTTQAREAGRVRANKIFPTCRGLGLHHLYVGPSRPVVTGLLTRKVVPDCIDMWQRSSILLQRCMHEKAGAGGATGGAASTSSGDSSGDSRDCHVTELRWFLAQHVCISNAWHVRAHSKFPSILASTYMLQDITEEICQLLLGERANAGAATSLISQPLQPFIPYHDKELRWV